jgi:hypothetical protein
MPRSRRILSPSIKGESSPENNKIMHSLFSPVLANFYYVGGGSAGLIVLIIVLVLLFRR